ncbi:MAG: C40 family peptidase [Chitinophagaceae bacterium]|nr:C40 family peptidase [Chitinophagaceae bacterium]
MEYAACKVPAAPVRKKASHKSEMVNQLLFGEAVMVLKIKKKWALIRSVPENYEGWITISHLEEIDGSLALQYDPWVTSDLLSVIDIGGKPMHISAGASLLGFDGKSGKFGTLEYYFSGNRIKRNEVIPGEEVVRKLSIQWLNAPYLWGGRTILGVDCSGFAKTIFKMMGIDLPRDAWQQAQKGKQVKKLKDAVAGDLAFFNDKEEIVHVGILLSNGEIIHSSGKVRIDTITKKGIISSDTGKRTHRLKMIRRYW